MKCSGKLAFEEIITAKIVDEFFGITILSRHHRATNLLKIMTDVSDTEAERVWYHTVEIL